MKPSVKLNNDVALNPTENNGGWGFVVKDDQGVLLEGGASKLLNVSSAVHVEAVTTLRCLERAAQMECHSRNNASILGASLKSDELDRSLFGCLSFNSEL